MTLRKRLRASRAPIIVACAAALAISPVAAAAQSTPLVTARAAAECPDAALAPDLDDLPRIAAAVLCLLNAEWLSAGLAPLSLDAQLGRASQPMADRMVWASLTGCPGASADVDGSCPRRYRC